MRSWGTSINIRFHKVEGHTGVKYNELADKMAKRGIEEGVGVPAFCNVELLEQYYE